MDTIVNTEIGDNLWELEFVVLFLVVNRNLGRVFHVDIYVIGLDTSPEVDEDLTPTDARLLGDVVHG